MTGRKYYAVRSGRQVGIYETWPQCEAQVRGFSGAEFRSFSELAEAEAFMAGAMKKTEESNDNIEKKIRELAAGEVIAFVDGSYSVDEEKSGFGVIIIDEEGEEIPLCKAFTKSDHEEFLELRNVAVELEGVKEAVNWAVTHRKNKVTIFYDYEGIGRWADGSWRANKDVTRQYSAFIREKRALIDVELIKVPAHAGIAYNEKADALARASLGEVETGEGSRT